MSFIKSDSLLSNIKNISIRIDMRPNDGSNIFKSIFSNLEEREKSIKFESLFDIDCELKEGNSLIDKLTGTSQQVTSENKEKERLHYNWIVCKNGGMSENEDSSENIDGDDNNENFEKEKIDAEHHENEYKKETNPISQHNNNNTNPLLISQLNNGFVFPSSSSMLDNNHNNTHHHHQQQYQQYHRHEYNNSSINNNMSNNNYNNNNSLSQISLLNYNNNTNNINNNNSYSSQQNSIIGTPIVNSNNNNNNNSSSRYLQNSLSLSSLNFLYGTSESVPEITEKKVKNETKNIPKNYGKAIICYIEKYRHKVELITEHFQIDYFALLEDLKRKKKSINTIADLRNLWSKYKYAKCMRVITYEFLRKHALSYIFDSRICTYGSHIKYRQRLCEAVASPEEFKHIKDY